MKEYAVSWSQADKFLNDMNHSGSDIAALDYLSTSDDLYPILEVTAGLDSQRYSLKVERSDPDFSEPADEKARFEGELPDQYNLEEEIGV